MICNCSCLSNGKELFLFGTRLAFGVWLLYLGLSKFIFIGPENFVGYISNSFAETWIPSFLILVTSWVILIGEVVLGAWLIIGKAPTLAWIATAKLMFILMFGQTVLQEHAVVFQNWHYFFIALLCASLSAEVNKCEA